MKPPQSDAWYARFFKRDYLQIYGHAFQTERTELESQFVIQSLGLKPGNFILDLCCGQGRHAIAIARTGINVTGVDLSDELLTLARETAADVAPTAEFVKADMRQLPDDLNGRFDAVINMFSAFGYLESQDEDQRVLLQIARVLKPDGKLLMDLLNREWVIINNEPYSWQQHDDGSTILEHRELDLLQSINHLTFTEIAPDGTRRLASELHMRLYTLTEMSQMLEAAGMELTDVFGGFNGEGYGVNTRRMILVARRKA